MVVFTCNHCGESLQKPRVEKHYNFVCRTVKSLTCVDCFKDFRGEEYVVHTKCITEEERYAAKGSLPNGVVKKGEVKQESWVDMVKSIIDKEKNLKPAHRNLLNTISNYSNIPRKKVKFINFIKSSTGGRVNFNDIEAVWDIIEKYKNEQTTNNNQISQNKSENTTTKEENDKRKLIDDEELDTPKKKKRKNEETLIEDSTEAKETTFSFQDKIIEILTAKGSISLNKLQKKVVKAYLKETGESECSPKVLKKYNKKLKKLANVEVSEDKATLLDSTD